MVLIFSLDFQVQKPTLELLWTTRKVAFSNISCLFYILLEYVVLMQVLKNKLNGIYGQVELEKKLMNGRGIWWWKNENKLLAFTAKNTVILPDFLVWNLAKRHSFRVVSANSPETMQKLCLSAKFLYQGIRWIYGIFRGDCESNQKWNGVIFTYDTCRKFWDGKNDDPQNI